MNERGDPAAGAAAGHDAQRGGRDAGRREVVITIDGPAGSGKSTTAKEVARRLGLRHLDSGGLYRALTLALLRSGVPPSEWARLDDDAFRRLAIRLRPGSGGFDVLLGDDVPGEALRSPEVTRLVPYLAGLPAARARLVELQRSAAELGGLVADGRDMGTVIFPDAPLKVYLTASLEERARRRLLQEGDGRTDEAAVRREAERLRERDEADEGRNVAPLRRPDDAFELDTTGLSFDEQVDRIVQAARGLSGS